jgi:hypothetical protein
MKIWLAALCVAFISGLALSAVADENVCLLSPASVSEGETAVTLPQAFATTLARRSIDRKRGPSTWYYGHDDCERSVNS